MTTHGDSAVDETISHQPPARLTAGQIMRLSALWFALQFFWASQQLAVMPDMIKAYTSDANIGFLYGLIKACGALFVMATQLTIGFISDHAYSKLGRRRPFIMVGIISGCVAITLFMLAPGYWWLFAGYMLIEITINVASVPFQSLLPDLVPRKQHAQAGSVMGLMHMLGYLISLFVLVASSFAVGDVLLSYRVILLPIFILLLLGFSLWTVLSVDEIGWAQVMRDKLTGAIRTIRLLPGTAVRFAATAPTLLGCMIHDYRKVELRTQSNFVFLWLSRFTVFLGYAAFIQYIKLYIDSNLDWQDWLISLGFNAEAISTSESAATAAFGAIVAFFIIGGLIGSRAAGPLADRFGKKTVIGAGMVVAALADIPLVMTSNVWMAIGCGIVIGLGWGAFISADWAFACTLMPKQKAGSYMGIWDISTLLPQVISPVLAGLLYQAVYAYYAGGAKFAFTLSTQGIPEDNPMAAALGFKYVITSLLVYFAIGLFVLRYVKEEHPQEQQAD